MNILNQDRHHEQNMMDWYSIPSVGCFCVYVRQVWITTLQISRYLFNNPTRVIPLFKKKQYLISKFYLFMYQHLVTVQGSHDMFLSDKYLSLYMAHDINIHSTWKGNCTWCNYIYKVLKIWCCRFFNKMPSSIRNGPMSL